MSSPKNCEVSHHRLWNMLFCSLWNLTRLFFIGMCLTRYCLTEFFILGWMFPLIHGCKTHCGPCDTRLTSSLKEQVHPKIKTTLIICSSPQSVSGASQQNGILPRSRCGQNNGLRNTKWLHTARPSIIQVSQSPEVSNCLENRLLTPTSQRFYLSIYSKDISLKKGENHLFCNQFGISGPRQILTTQHKLYFCILKELPIYHSCVGECEAPGMFCWSRNLARLFVGMWLS